MFSIFFLVFDQSLLQKTNDNSIKQMMSPFSYFQPILNKLFNIRIKLRWY